MVTKEALIEQFQNLGCNVENNTILEKCLDLCNQYQLNEETMIDTWVAFSAERFKSFDVTMEALEQMERMELKRDSKPVMELRLENDLSKLDLHSSKQYIENDDILELYGGKQFTTPKTKRLRSPESPETMVQSQESKVRAVESTFSPCSYSSRTTTPNRQPVKVISSKILLSFGEDVISWKNTKSYVAQIKRSKDPHVPSKALYMFELLSRKRATLTFTCYNIGVKICEIWHKRKNDDLQTTWNVKTNSQNNFRTWGRVSCSTDRKLTTASILLAGSKSSNVIKEASTVKLDLSNVQRYSIFPGQVLAVEGVNPTGGTLVVKDLFTENYAPFPKSPSISENLNLVIAAGPFTLSENLNYQPLWDLMEHVVKDEPHVLILIGPFVEFSHPEIQNASIKQTFQELFEMIIEKIMDRVKETCTQVVLVPSNRDAQHDPIYPTPEYFLPKTLQSPNLHLMPDPCMLDIEGLILGITSVDVLMHLGHEEINSNMTGMDRLSRLASHLLAQTCFYPLYPPAETLNVDMDLWEQYAFMKQQPHLLVLPSNMRSFCNNINGCVVLNPERLSKYFFAKLRIRPVLNGAWSKDNVSCEILKI